MLENNQLDKKSLRVLTEKKPDWDEIAKDCIAFANALGGKIIFGIEDKESEPPENQKVPKNCIVDLVKNIQNRTINDYVLPQIIQTPNNSEYLQLTVQRSSVSIAATTSGKYYYRIADQSKPLLPDELSRLMNDKNAFVWETQTFLKIKDTDFDKSKADNFINDIKKSDRISNFIKEKNVEEIFEYYFFTSNGYLTNLGVLWIGKREHRAKLLYSPCVQFIKYDEFENKVNKILWDDYSLNPKELINEIWNMIPEWKDSIEIADGIFRKNIPNYDEVVVRELVANAIVHRPYNTRGDIFIKLYPERLEIQNPGLFPLGVTPKNILHKSVLRNPLLAKVFYDLKLMEKEGSGYDRIYATLLAGGKKLPVPFEDDDRVCVTVFKQIVNKNIINFMDKIQKELQLSVKERISLGLIAQHNSLSAVEFAKLLDLNEKNSIRNWLGNLVDWNIVKTSGNTKGKKYFVTPELLNRLDFKGITNLKKIEIPRLKSLIEEILKIYPYSNFGSLHQRIGIEIPIRLIRYVLNDLIKSGTVNKQGETKAAKYHLTK